MTWTAAVSEDKETLEKGELVRIVKIEGVKLIVERVEQVKGED